MLGRQLFTCLNIDCFYWVLTLAYLTYLGLKGFVVVVVISGHGKNITANVVVAGESMDVLLSSIAHGYLSFGAAGKVRHTVI